MRGICCLWRRVSQSSSLVARHSPPTNTFRPPGIGRKSLRALALILLSPLFISHSAVLLRAQTGNASVSGRVTDPNGAVIPRTTIEAIDEATNSKATTQSNGDGLYYFSALPPAVYRIVVSKDGFRQIIEGDVTLHTQDSLTLNFALQIGSVNETVTVNADNEHMPTDNPAVGLLVSRDFVENMPLNGRSFQDLLALTPGATFDNAPGGSGLLSINGQYGDANYFTVDGVSMNTNAPVAGQYASGVDPRGLAGVLPAQTALGTTQSLLSVDALQEIKIQTSGYSAEYGRQPGGQVQLTSRSGGNDFHGSLFDYFRNEALDANTWFFNHQTPMIPRQPERQNDFGGTFGGPVRIPHVYNGEDKTFFFVDYEGLRLDLPQFASLTVPTMAFRQFASPAWQPILNSSPVPNGPSNNDPCASAVGSGFAFPCTAAWSGAFPDLSSLNSTNVRVDQVIDHHIQIFARYSDVPSKANTISPGNGGLENVANTQDQRSWTVGATWGITPHIVDELRLNWTHNLGQAIDTPSGVGGATPFPLDSVVPAQYAPAGTTASADPGIIIPDPVLGTIFIAPDYLSERMTVRQFNLVDSVAWSYGRQTFKFGVDFRRLQSGFNTGQYGAILYAFSAASVQQGIADDVITQAGEPGSPTFNNLSVFAQDDWRLTSRLTVNYGLRWEFDPAPGASDGQYPLALTTGNISQAVLAAPGTPQYQTRYLNFAPRFGLAYQVTPSSAHPVVVRAGFGIFYDTGQSLGATGYDGYPFVAANFAGSSPLPVPVAQLAPPSLNAPLVPPYGEIGGVITSDPKLTVPYTESWNLTVSEGLSSKNTLTMSYVGNAGRKLLFTSDYGACCGTVLPANPLFTFLQVASNAADSSYNGFQLLDQGDVLPGMQLIASYTWAHAIDNSSVDFGGLYPVRGNSDNDVRQNVNLAINYRIPGAASTRIERALTSGWSLDSRFTARSGIPINVFQSTYFINQAEQLTGFVMPNLVPNVPVVLRNVPGDPFGWALNPAAFAPVPLNPDGSPVSQGNLARNFIHGPNFWDYTMAVQRQFPLSERVKLLFRAEAFNIFNHANAGQPSNCLCYGPSFGQINGLATLGVPNQLYATGSARSLQLALKLQF
jgi:Carboxypeptidase regulatory-like domain/TonB dependent receptor/TonB-dependent Receptor Plug Domain